MPQIGPKIMGLKLVNHLNLFQVQIKCPLCLIILCTFMKCNSPDKSKKIYDESMKYICALEQKEKKRKCDPSNQSSEDMDVCYFVIIFLML